MGVRKWRFPFAAASLLLPCGAFGQQSFPAKPIRMLVPFSPGSQTEFSRAGSAKRWRKLGHSRSSSTNRPSAAGTIASQYVSRQIPTDTPS